MRVILSFVGGWGHAEPLLELAAVAARMGHRVAFAGQAGVVPRLAALGYDTHVVGPDTLATSRRPLAPVDRAAEQAVIRDVFVGTFGLIRAASLGELYDRDRPDLVVCDEVDVGAVVAAELRGIPCVTVAVLAAGRMLHPGAIGEAWNALRHEVGLDPDPQGLRLVGHLAVAPLPRSFRSPRATKPTSLRFVRPAILDGVGPTTGPDLVLATLGTVFNLESGDLLDRLIEAMNVLTIDNGVDAVITTGPHVDPEDLPRPGPRVHIATFVPQREILQRCRAVISHAGSGTLMAALSLGIPVVNLALGADQFDNAERCTELGVGVALDPVASTPSAIAEGAAGVLGDERYRLAAARLADEATAQPALECLAELRVLLRADA